MGYCIDENQMDRFLHALQKEYRIFAPVRFEGGGRFSDTDCIHYSEISSISEVELKQKTQYSFKEILMPVSQTLFFFTEQEVKEPDLAEKAALIFVRSCDVHALRSLDAMYLNNGPQDYYYRKLRRNIKLILIGCSQSFENCFCVSMGTNQTDEYAFSVDQGPDDSYLVDCKEVEWNPILAELGGFKQEISPAYVTENEILVQVPENLNASVAKSRMWEEYDKRCINCGRCNFVCPTCTCFSMQDIYYSENGKVGERRKVWASCMVDGFTDVAGGGSYRQKNGERMRFKVLHKVLDFKQRNGFQMCVGCGLCDDICPEYISFSNCINKLEAGMKEVEHA